MAVLPKDAQILTRYLTNGMPDHQKLELDTRYFMEKIKKLIEPASKSNCEACHHERHSIAEELKEFIVFDCDHTLNGDCKATFENKIVHNFQYAVTHFLEKDEIARLLDMELQSGIPIFHMIKLRLLKAEKKVIKK